MTKRTMIIAIIIFLPVSIIGISILINLYTEDSSPPIIEPPIVSEEPEVVVSPPEVDEDLSLLESMTLEEKIGQLLIIGYKEDQPTERIRELIEKTHVGGFILFNRNYSNLESMVLVTNQLKTWNNTNKLPLFISIDEEGGTVTRLPQEGTIFPDARLLGEINDPDLTLRVGTVIGKELRALGINMNFAPVMDIVSSPENKLLFKRAFGGNPDIVSKHGMEFIKGLQSSGIVAVPKHFPGHGSTIVDSHGNLPKIMIDRDTLLSRELTPFKGAIASGVDGIMAGHLSFPLIDTTELPATKSEVILDDILRKELGYTGLIITDDIEMLGYMKDKNQLSTGILQSLKAGVDLFVIGHTYEVQIEVIDIIKEAVENNTISEARIDESVLRIIKTKNKYIGDSDKIVDLDEAKKVVGSEEHKQVLEEIMERRP